MATLAEDLSSTSRSRPSERFGIGDPAHIPPAPHRAPHTPLQEQRGFPWALAIAILIVIGVEVGLRMSHWPRRIPYELELDEYFAVAAQLDRFGPADIAIVGSSRTRESIDVPFMKRMLDQSLGANVRIANYGVSGGRTCDDEAIVNRLLRDPNPPKLIVVGISERDLAGERGMFDRVPLFWNWDDWKSWWQRNRAFAIENLPTVIRNYVANHWRTLKYREQIRLRLRQLVTGDRSESSPIAGDNTPWQKIHQRRTLVTRPVSQAEVKRYLRDIQLKKYPDQSLRDALARLAEACKAKGVPLIIYEIPTPHILQRNLPPRVYDKYIREVKRIANANNARFIRVSSLKLRIGDGDFREPSHMGSAGAKRFTKALTHRVIAPAAKAAISTAPQASGAE